MKFKYSLRILSTWTKKCFSLTGNAIFFVTRQHDILSNLIVPGIWINKRHIKNVYIYSLLTHSKVDPSTFPRRVSHCYKDFHNSYLKFRKDLCIVLWDFALQWPSLIALKLSASQVYTSSRAQDLKVCSCKRTRM